MPKRLALEKLEQLKKDIMAANVKDSVRNNWAPELGKTYGISPATVLKIAKDPKVIGPGTRGRKQKGVAAGNRGPVARKAPQGKLQQEMKTVGGMMMLTFWGDNERLKALQRALSS